MSTVTTDESVQEIVVMDDEDVIPAIVRVSEKTLAESVYAVEMPITTRYQFDLETVKAITQRKLKAIAQITPVAKRGTAKVTNTSTYDYAKPEDVFRAANEALVEAGLDVTPIPRGTQQILAGKTYNGVDMVLTRLYVDMLVASEEGFVLYPWFADSKMMDPSKAIQAAMTYAHRTFLIHFLRIPTPSLEDADEESHVPPSQQQQPRQRRPAPKPKPTPPPMPTPNNGSTEQPNGKPNGTPAKPNETSAKPNGNAGREKLGPDWNVQFWTTVEELGYWNGDDGTVNKAHFFQSLKKSWPQNPGLSHKNADELLTWARRYADLKRQAEKDGREDLSDEERQKLIAELTTELYG